MKKVLITGGSGGIGLATVKTFIKKGYFVVAGYNKNGKALEELRATLSEEERCMLYCFSCDLEDEESIYSAYSSIEKQFSRFDVLVNNAGIDLYKLCTETSNKEWDRIFAVNMKSAFIFSKLLLEKMIENESGSIVNVSSVWGISGASMETAYSSSKSALIGFTKALAKEVAPSNIRVNCIAPGVIDTKMNDCFSEGEKKDLVERTPLKRLGKPEEIAELIYFLASENSSFITGEVITSDGGFNL